MITCFVRVNANEIHATGTTETQVSYGEGGRAHIVPAAMQNDVSYNAFSQFDVSAAGAVFENTDVLARTIVAEVFSNHPSRIEGPVEVNGPRANLILANQNGLVVNGGGFVNFGHVALTTGKIALRDEVQAGHVVRRYVDLATSAGEIQIEGQGLSANLIRLELIAKRISLSGDLTNTFTSATAGTRLVAGDTKTTFDTAVSPTDNLTPWAYHTAWTQDLPQQEQQDPRYDSVAISVNAASTVTSGRIDVLINEEGAGFRNSGTLLASAGDFTLSSTGAVEQMGGRISAAGNMTIVAESYRQQNALERPTLLSAFGQVAVDVAGDIENYAGEIIGGYGQALVDSEPGPDASVQQREEEETTETQPLWAVHLKAGGRFVHETPIGADQQAILFGEVDGVLINAKQGIAVSNARVISNSELRLVTEGDAINRTFYEEGGPRVEWSSGGVLNPRMGFRVNLGALKDAGRESYWVAQGGIAVQAKNIENTGGYIFSNNGAVRLDADEAIRNQALNTGTYEYSSKCFVFFCRRTASSTQALVGGHILASNGLEFNAGQEIYNEGGQIYTATQDMRLDAPRTIAVGVPVYTVITRANGLKALFGDAWAKLYATDQGGSYTAQNGRIVLGGQGGVQDGGVFQADQGIEGEVDVIRVPQRDPVYLEDHLGIFW